MQGIIWCIIKLGITNNYGFAGSNGTIGIWKNFEYQALSIVAHACDIYCLIYIENSKWIISGSKDRTIKIWNTINGELISELLGHSEAIISLGEVKKKSWIVSGSDKGIIKLWNLSTMFCLKTIEAHTGSIRCLGYIENGEKLISGGTDKILKVWNIHDLSLN